jgi:hypothetical protein
MAGLEAVGPKKLLPESIVAEARQELFEIREGVLRLMNEFRGAAKAGLALNFPTSGASIRATGGGRERPAPEMSLCWR